MNCCDGDGEGDLWRWAVKARSGQWLRGKRVLGARPARRRRRRRSCWTWWDSARSTVGAATPARWQRLRRPRWRKARERCRGRMEVSRGSGARRGGRPARPRARRQAGGAVASSRTPASPLCLLWREQAADWPWASTVLGPQVGCQVSFPLCFLFFFVFVSVLCFQIVEILSHLRKSWKYSEAHLKLFSTA